MAGREGDAVGAGSVGSAAPVGESEVGDGVAVGAIGGGSTGAGARDVSTGADVVNV
ncbi:hypothetical protein QFZ36_003238 [Pseudarthrobacter siccitolerans]|uniref:Uncharacterized protein n=1 Tax=Pseudarthrobacter siccitolerans TaxID=861266 RepID=A0ABU0PQ35_9MICC|nr:hypothetical protein [Pseudarthrobacter siccitolerans]MDQ0675677.1 hypothetical protein [Pseudarthrobacter siccitolerans]